MSTEYNITPLLDVRLSEQSSYVCFVLEDTVNGDINNSAYMNAKDLRQSIIKQIEVLSYISNDAEEVLQRFNVKYGDKQ